MVTQNAANNKTGASGTVLQGQGVGTASDFSTATYPSTATGTGTILRADGTNLVATSATYPTTSTINQVLHSSAADTVGGIATANNGVLIASNTGVPSMLAAGTINQVLTANTAAPPSWQEARGYALYFSCSNGDPAVANKYYIGTAQALTASTASGLAIQQRYIPVAGKINKAYGVFTSTFNNLATSAVYIRLNNTTDYLIANLAETSAEVAFNNTSLGITVAAGDYIEVYYYNNVFFVSTVARVSVTVYIE